MGYEFHTVFFCQHESLPGFHHILTAKYLFYKLQEKLLLQLQQTQDLAALTQEVGTHELIQWLQLNIDNVTLTLLTYHHRPKTRQPSMYVLDEAKCECKSVFYLHLCGLSVTVPSKGSALDELLVQTKKPSRAHLATAAALGGTVDGLHPAQDPAVSIAPILPPSMLICLKNAIELEYNQ